MAVINGDGANNTLIGFGAADMIDGKVGNDVLFGLGSGDTMIGGVGLDVMSGGDGADSMVGGNGGDTVYGDAGADVLRGQRDNDQLFGGGGRDSLDGGVGNDLLEGGDGNDSLDGRENNDILIGGDGDDLLLGFSGTDTAVFGGNLADYSFGADGDNLVVTDLVGDDGEDTLSNVDFLHFADETLAVDDFGPAFGGRTSLLADSINGTELWSGDGNTITNFNIVNNNDDVELALKAKIRQGPDIVPEGNVYEAPTGTQSTANGSFIDNPNRAAWSFDFSVNGDADNNGLPAGFQFQIDIDVDRTEATDYRSYFRGTIADSTPFFGDGISPDGTVVDNSQNYVFATTLFPALSPYDPDDEAQYSIRLSAFDDDQLLSVVEIVVVVTDEFVPMM